jgi:carboxyl-terminal processing protease
METLFKKFGPLAKAAKSQTEFATQVNAMIAEFKDSHFAFLDKDSQGYYLMDSLASSSPKSVPHFGAWFRETPQGYTVQMVLDGSAAEAAKLKKGDVILSVEGKPFSPVAALRGLEGKSVKLEVKSGDKIETRQVEVTEQPALEAFLEASRKSTKVIEHNGRKIGYFHLWTQANDKFREAVSSAVYGKLRDTDAMILDLRDGFGGRPEGFADPFFRPEVELKWMMTPTQGTTQLFGYGRPLVVLINEGSGSAKEVLSFIFKKSKRAILVGSQTAGHVLGTTPYRLNDWAYLEIPMVEVFADGVRLENNGVKPDFEVKTERSPDGTDRQLAKALDLLKDSPKRSK